MGDHQERQLVARLVPWAVVPVPFLGLAIGVLWLLRPEGAFESRGLLAVLNFTFVTCTAAVVALLAGRTFVATGAPGTLFLGTGALVMGAAFLAAPLAGARTPNVIATVHNIGMMAAGLLSLVGAWLCYRPRGAVRAPGPALVAAYAGSVALVAITASLAVHGVTPPFFVQDAGGTPIRQAVLASAVVLLVTAGFALVLASGNATTFRRWYALGLVLLGVGLLGVMLEEELGTPISWVGRISQYLGSIYLLVASVTSATAARRWGLPLEAELREEREAARQFREAKQQLARVLDGSNDGFWDWNLRNGQVDWSDRWAEMFGYRRPEISPSISAWQGMAHPDEREAARGAMNRLLRGEVGFYDEERRFRHKDGHWVWVRVRGKVVEQDEDGKPSRVAGTCTDISERKRAEAALAESQCRLALILDNVRDGINLLDLRTGKYAFMSPSQVAMTGFTESEVRDMSVEEARDRCHPDDRHISVEQQNSIAAGSQDLGTVEYRWKVKSGEYRWFSDSRRVVRDETGQAVVLVGVSRDITERKRMEDVLRKTKERLSLAIDGSGDGFWDLDVPSGTGKYSRGWAGMLGYDLGELVPEIATWKRLVHPEDLGRVMAQLEAHLRGDTEHYEVEHRLRHKDGRWVWVLARGRVVGRSSDGSPLRMAGTHTDVSERKRAEEARRAAEEEIRTIQQAAADETQRRQLELEAILESAMDGIYVLDAEGCVLMVNQAACALLGHVREELLGRNLAQIGLLEEGRDTRARIQQILRTGGERFEARHRSTGGDLVETEVSARAVADGSGKLVAFVRDVRERKAAERALASAHAELQGHVTNTPLALVEWDGQYHVTRFSRRAEEMFGWGASEVVGKRIDEVPWVPEEDWPLVRQVMRDMDAGARPSNLSRNRNRRKDGSVIDCEWYNSSQYGVDGKITSVFSLVHDVTLREEARTALQASERRFRTLADEAPVGVFETDASGVIGYLNAESARLLGQAVEEARGRPWSDAIHPEDRDRVSREWSDTIAAERSFHDEHRVVSRGGPVAEVVVHGSPIRDENHRLKGYVGVVIDVTRQRSLQRQVEVGNRLAALGTLVAGLAHEINNPLAAEMAGQGLALEIARTAREQLRIGAPIDASRKVKELDEAVEALEDAQEAGNRIARVVREMAAFARPDRVHSAIRMREVVDQALRLVALAGARVGQVQVEDQGAPEIMGSAGQLAQVVQNLVANAIQATHPGDAPAVTVRLRTDEEGQALVEVIDRGVGIAPELLAKVFDPFFTTRPTGEGRGTGLGLPVCHAIVTAHKGMLAVASEPGRGSTFSVRLPPAGKTAGQGNRTPQQPFS